MSKASVEALLEAGGKDKTVQAKYDATKTKEEFIALALSDGYDFTLAELDEVLNESGDSFELIGNPPKRHMWWK